MSKLFKTPKASVSGKTGLVKAVGSPIQRSILVKNNESSDAESTTQFNVHLAIASQTAKSIGKEKSRVSRNVLNSLKSSNTAKALTSLKI